MDVKSIVKEMFPFLYLRRYNKMMDAKVMRNRQLKALSFDEKLEELKRIYFRKLGEDLNLDNPQTWNEKIQWLKVFDATHEKSEWTDKIKAKSLASQTIGEQYVVPLLHKGVKKLKKSILIFFLISSY